MTIIDIVWLVGFVPAIGLFIRNNSMDDLGGVDLTRYIAMLLAGLFSWGYIVFYFMDKKSKGESQ